MADMKKIGVAEVDAGDGLKWWVLLERLNINSDINGPGGKSK